MIVEIENLLAKCHVFRVDTEVSQICVICDTDETFVELVKQEKQLIYALTIERESWDEILLKLEEGERSTKFYPPELQLSATNSMAHSSIIIIPEMEIIGEIMRFPNPSSLIRVEDDKGIFTNSHCQKSSGITPNDWLGAKMSSYWIPEELERYKQLLTKDKEVINFTYTAYFFTGEPANFTVDARLVNFNGDLCRWVRVLDCQVIS